jgi:pilus assembly protein CpaF
VSAAFIVVGVKGGVGATTLCVDLARAARRIKRSVTVVDADLGGRRHVAELLDGIRPLNANRGGSIYSVARVGEIDIVELVDKYDDSFALRRNELEGLANDITQDGNLVLVDAPRPFEMNVSPFVARASHVLLVMEPDHLGSASSRTMIRDLSRFGIPTAQMWLVVNERGRSEIAVRELEKLLGLAVVADLPRRGDRRSERAIDTLLKKMIEAPDEPAFSNLSSAFWSDASRVSSNGSTSHQGIALAGHSAIAVAEDPVEREALERRNRVRSEISEQMVSRIDLVAASRGHSDAEKIGQLRATIDKILDELLESRSDAVEFTLSDRASLKQEIIDEQLGLGPLEELMRDPAVSEVMVNGPKRIYVERAGKLSLSERTFNDERQLRLVIERIVAPIGRRIDEASPMVDARLSDGSRVNAIIEPLALKGSSLTIRRFGTRRLTVDDLIRFGSIPEKAVGFLRAIVEGKLNVIVSGGTGTGKTTFLNILSNFIPATDRIVTIEDAAELSLNQDHVVSLESRPSNIEGKGAITIRDLVKNSLRMRPDRIVVGECRGGEALDMLQAMNTGHDGSLTTLHANTPRDALARLETLVLMAGFDLPIKAIREQIASAVDVIVQIERMRDGSRKCTSITEVVGMEGDVVTLQEIVNFRATGLDDAGKVTGSFGYTGVQPHYMERFEENGVHFDVRELSGLLATESVW